MQRSETIGKLAEALSKAQGKIIGAVKDSENPFFRSHYADLASVWDACRQPLSENGLAVVQTILSGSEQSSYLETTLVHSSGEFISGAQPMKPVKDDPQGWGSCITYYRRYGLAAIVGIAQIDDDGNVASGKPSVNTAEAAQEVAKQKIADLQAKVNPPGKSAEDFVKNHPNVTSVPKQKQEIVEIQGLVGALSKEKETKAKSKYHTLYIGDQEVFVFDSKIKDRLKAVATYETAVRCEKKDVSGRTIYTVVSFVADLVDQELGI